TRSRTGSRSRRSTSCWDGSVRAEQVAGALRALIRDGASVRGDVEGIVAAVRAGGDAALREHVERFDGLAAGTPLRASAEELEAAAEALPVDVRAALELAMSNVAAVATVSLGGDGEVDLP